MPQSARRRLLDHLIGPLEQRRRDREAEGIGCLEIDDQLELRRLLDGQVGGLDVFQDLVQVGAARRKESARFGPWDIRPPASTLALDPYTAGIRILAARSTRCLGSRPWAQYVFGPIDAADNAAQSRRVNELDIGHRLDARTRQ